MLESAVQTPRATYAGQLLHEGIFAVASAYMFHVVQNHPFVDGNKRAGSAAALVFLEFNGVELDMLDEQLVDLTINVATGKSDKSKIESVLRAHAIVGD